MAWYSAEDKDNCEDYVFLQSPQEEADKSIDFGESEIEQSTVFLESFRIGGYDEMAQVKDLHITVDDPEKHIGGYVSYNVTTKVGLLLIVWNVVSSLCYIVV